MEKVSIIIPVYNVCRYIARCLQSVSEQQYFNIECLIIDDCGNDNSIEIANNFINSYHGPISFTVLHHKHNKGLSAARNTGLRNATGQYVFFLDSDDSITKDCIYHLVSLALKYKDVDFVQGNTVTGSKELMDYGFKCKVPEYTNEKKCLHRLILADLSMTVWNRLIRRSFLIDNNLFFPEGIVCEDMYWTYFFAKHTTAASFTDKGTYLYYCNNNSIMTSKSRSNLLKHFDAHIIATTAFYDDIIQSPEISKYQRQYFAGNLISTMPIMSKLHSLSIWYRFWKLSCNIAWKFRNKYSFYRILLFISMMPPLCFLSGLNGWTWRLKYYIVSNT